MTDGQKLVLRIENKEPLPAAWVANALQALSADYQRTTGRDLIIAQIETGSLIVTFFDWLGKANDLIDFAKHIKEVWMAAMAAKLRLSKSKKPGAQSARALAELAMKSGAALELSEVNADGSSISLRVIPEEAFRVREMEDLVATRRRERREASDQILAEGELERFAKTAIDRLGRGDTLDENDGLMMVIRALLEVIKAQPNGAAMLNRVALRLQQQGYDPTALFNL
jgi:hypothetical protein